MANESGINIKASNSYIVKDSYPNRALNLLSEMLDQQYKVMCVTRTHPLELIDDDNLSTIWLTNQKDTGYVTTGSLNDLFSKLKTFIRKNQKSVVLLDRIDYVINMFGFNEFLKLVYSLNDEITAKKSILMVNVNPTVFKSTELALLEQELKDLPRSDRSASTELSDDLSEILVFVNYNEKVTFKKISKQFSITKTTTRKRMNRLEELGLISVKKNGRNKVVRITDHGRNYL